MSDWLKVTAKIVPPKDGPLTVGAPFTLVIEAAHAPGGVALLPQALPLPEGLAERLSERAHTRSDEGGAEIDRFELELLAFDAGPQTIAPIELALGSTKAVSRELVVEIASGLADSELPVATSTLPEALAELERMAATNPPPRSVMVSDYGLLYGGGALAAVIIGALLLRRLLARLKARQALAPPPPPPPPRPAHEVAFERLEALRAADPLARGEHKVFWVTLSEILRAYVGSRYHFDSVELTVAELVGTLRTMRTPGLELGQLERILNEADLAKFAKYVPSDAEAHSALNGAFDVVDHTKPREQDHAA